MQRAVVVLRFYEQLSGAKVARTRKDLHKNFPPEKLQGYIRPVRPPFANFAEWVLGTLPRIRRFAGQN
ncbi:MAG: hypothetical protein JWN47_2498, partial [Frankiales bacterium]|nr:hypothetical protein [Frankiales bacterium]